MARDVVRSLTSIKLWAMLCAGAVAGVLGWFIVGRLGVALEQQQRAVESLAEPARLLIRAPLLASVPGALTMALCMVGLAVPRLRLAALLLATLVMLLAVVALLATLLQVLGPMYEMQRL